MSAQDLADGELKTLRARDFAGPQCFSLADQIAV
jgi:hypothetical protein